MIKSLETISPSMPDERKWQAVRDNFVTLAKGQQKLGIEMLFETTSSAQVAFGATESRYPGFGVQAHTSGGVVGIKFQSTALVGASNLYVYLKVDGEVVESTFVSSESTVIYVPVSLNWYGELNEGSHTFEVYAKAQAGISYLGKADLVASMQVVEFLNY
jgi:hypothetical protein